jgi:hypothetical protein
MALSTNIPGLIRRALDVSDLMQGYVDIACDLVEEFKDGGGDLSTLRANVEQIKIKGPEDAAAKAILLHLIGYEQKRKR